MHGKFGKSNTSNNGLRNHKPPSLQPSLAPSNFHLFGAMKRHLGQKISTGNKLGHGVLNWLDSQDKKFVLLASVTCQDDGGKKKC
jgi:hypothetical protein